MDMLSGETEVRDYPLERLMMLSDGVFAIAMTLLALELRAPEHWNHGLAALLESLSAPIQAFFWSFFSCSMFWTVHRRLFGLYRRADGPLTVINLVLLGEITLIPVTTRILTSLDQSGESLILYLGLFGLIGLTNTAGWVYAAFLTNIVKPGMGRPSRIVIAAMNAILPVAMTSLGVLANRPGLGWLPLCIPAMFVASTWLRRAVGRHDGSVA
jgi:uncharacterized membrane protein